MDFDIDCSDNGKGNCNDSHNSEDHIMGLLLILVIPLMIDGDKYVNAMTVTVMMMVEIMMAI